jgi:hypothetical protein
MSVERLQAQIEATASGVLPDGDHLVTLAEVAVVPRKKGGYWLRLVSKSDADVYAREMRRLGDDDQYPFAVSDSRKRSLLELARRLGLDVDPRTEVELVVEQMKGLAGSAVTVSITRNAHQTVVRHSAPTGSVIATAAGELTVQGEIVEPGDAFVSHQKLIDGLNRSRLALALVAEAAYELSRSQGYRSLGYDTLAEYLADPAICLSRTTFFDLAAVYERYVVEGGADAQRLQVAGLSKLTIPLRALGSGEVDVDEALADVEELGRRDLRAKYQGEDEGEEQSGQPDSCLRCAGIPDEVLEKLRVRYAI